MCADALLIAHARIFDLIFKYISHGVGELVLSCVGREPCWAGGIRFHLHRPLVCCFNYWRQLRMRSNQHTKVFPRCTGIFPARIGAHSNQQEVTLAERSHRAQPCWMPTIVIVIHSISRWKDDARKKHIPIPQIETERKVCRDWCAHTYNFA